MRSSGGRAAARGGLYLLLALCSIAFMIPFLFAVGTSLKPISLLHIYPPILFPPLGDIHPEAGTSLQHLPHPFDQRQVEAAVQGLGEEPGLDVLLALAVTERQCDPAGAQEDRHR